MVRDEMHRGINQPSESGLPPRGKILKVKSPLSILIISSRISYAIMLYRLCCNNFLDHPRIAQRPSNN